MSNNSLKTFEKKKEVHTERREGELTKTNEHEPVLCKSLLKKVKE